MNKVNARQLWHYGSNAALVAFAISQQVDWMSILPPDMAMKVVTGAAVAKLLVNAFQGATPGVNSADNSGK